MNKVPCSGAVPVQYVEIFAGEKFTSVDTGLNGSETAQDTDLFHVTNERDDVQPLQFSIDGVKPADQVFQEQLEGLR